MISALPPRIAKLRCRVTLDRQVGDDGCRGRAASKRLSIALIHPPASTTVSGPNRPGLRPCPRSSPLPDIPRSHKDHVPLGRRIHRGLNGSEVATPVERDDPCPRACVAEAKPSNKSIIKTVKNLMRKPSTLRPSPRNRARDLEPINIARRHHDEVLRPAVFVLPGENVIVDSRVGSK